MNKRENFKREEMYKGNNKTDWNREQKVSNTSRDDEWGKPHNERHLCLVKQGL